MLQNLYYLVFSIHIQCSDTTKAKFEFVSYPSKLLYHGRIYRNAKYLTEKYGVEITVTAAPGATSGLIAWNDRHAACSLGRAGIRKEKQEGDGATPMGIFPLRHLLYRPDRISTPQTGLTTTTIEPNDGWCDDPSDPHYNQLISLPSPVHHEALWRNDSLYDLVMVIGHNDYPVIPGCGSAVFIHMGNPGLIPTEGCVGLTWHDLINLAGDCTPGDSLRISITSS